MGGTWKHEESVRRFFLKVDKDGPVASSELGPCWLFLGATNSNGYGQLRRNGALSYAHVFAFELENGPVPDGLELDHLCRIRRCVRPSHLEPVAHAENLRRGERWVRRQLELVRLAATQREDGPAL